MFEAVLHVSNIYRHVLGFNPVGLIDGASRPLVVVNEIPFPDAHVVVLGCFVPHEMWMMRTVCFLGQKRKELFELL